MRFVFFQMRGLFCGKSKPQAKTFKMVELEGRLRNCRNPLQRRTDQSLAKRFPRRQEEKGKDDWLIFQVGDDL